MDSKFQAAWFYFCIINQFQASSTFVFNSCDELTKYCYSVELLSSFTKIFECMHILEVSLILQYDFRTKRRKESVATS